MRILSFLLCVVFFSACDLIEYSPNQAFDNSSPKELNRKNLERLFENPQDDTIRFVFSGDSQRAYKNTEDLVTTVNRIKGVDFLLLGGDISDFGLFKEMEWIAEIFSKLNVPSIAVIGNHDMVANGEKIYKNMFGPLDFSFTYSGVKFICHNTNSREKNFNGNVPDIDFLKRELAPSPGVNAYVTAAHVPPTSPDFDPNLKTEYINTINSRNTLAALYAHDHSFSIRYPNNQTIPYLVSSAIVKRQFLLIEIVDGKFYYEIISY